MYFSRTLTFAYEQVNFKAKYRRSTNDVSECSMTSIDYIANYTLPCNTITSRARKTYLVTLNL